MDAAKSVTADFIAGSTLTVNRSGTGIGSVSSSPSGIDCPSTCVVPYATGTSVVLTETPGIDSVFLGWGGSCSGKTTTCTVAMSAAKKVTPKFGAIGPDGLIKRSSVATYVGDGIYNATGASQVVSAPTPRTSTATFDVVVQNDRVASDSFTVTGCGDAAGFVVTYTDSSGDVTAQVEAGTYGLTLAPGASAQLTMSVKVQNSATVGTKLTCLVTATSSTDPVRVDAVKATVKAT